MVDQKKLQSTINWLVSGAQPPKNMRSVVAECAKRLIAAGIPLDFISIDGIFLNAQLRGIRTMWSNRHGVVQDILDIEFMDKGAFQATPQYECVSSERVLRFRLEEIELETASDTLKNYAAAKYIDLIFLPLFNFDGTVTGVIEAATRKIGGFDDEQVVALRRMQASIARMKEYFTERKDKEMTLATYLGPKASQKVLSGKIALGDGEKISAVVLFADISGFTEMSNTLGSEDVLQVLRRFFTAVDHAVTENNGEILKFIGDGVLAIFQTPDDLTAQEEAAGAALQALETARAKLAAQSDTPKLKFRASLHIGDLFFGNVGSDARLDFTAIGPTVNLASRMLQEAPSQNALTVCSQLFKDVAQPEAAKRVDCEFKGFEGKIGMFILG